MTCWKNTRCGIFQPILRDLVLRAVRGPFHLEHGDPSRNALIDKWVDVVTAYDARSSAELAAQSASMQDIKASRAARRAARANAPDPP